jgi:hypothetical protein
MTAGQAQTRMPSTQPATDWLAHPIALAAHSQARRAAPGALGCLDPTDVRQEAALLAWQERDTQLPTGVDPEAAAKRVGMSLAIDIARREGAYTRDGNLRPMGMARDIDDALGLPCPAPGPEEHADTAERLGRLGAMPRRWQQVAYLALQGLALAEIGAQLNPPANHGRVSQILGDIARWVEDGTLPALKRGDTHDTAEDALPVGGHNLARVQVLARQARDQAARAALQRASQDQAARAATEQAATVQRVTAEADAARRLYDEAMGLG